MIASFHWIRPFWLLGFIPLLLLIFLRKKLYKLSSWSHVCDAPLMEFLVIDAPKRYSALATLCTALSFMLISLAGPSWVKLAVPSYQNNAPRVILLDLSEEMNTKDISPSRLARAKFKLHDLFQLKTGDLYGLIAFTERAFVVSPVTEDANTIDSLVDSLTTDIMPVQGYVLSNALLEAADLVKNAGFTYGNLLVITASTPDAASIATARALSRQKITTSILPIGKNSKLSSEYRPLAKAGNGMLLSFTNTNEDLQQWLKSTRQNDKLERLQNEAAPIYRDEGRWFLIPVLLLLVPVFRRNWLQRMDG